MKMPICLVTLIVNNVLLKFRLHSAILRNREWLFLFLSLNIEKKELCDLRGKISLKYQIQNLISYSIYSFIPFGFKVLVYLRSMKQKLK